LGTLDHPNILKLYEFYDEAYYYVLVTELVSGGELIKSFTKDTSLTEQKAAVLIGRLLNCVNYYHSKGIVHRDLKPENILLEAGRDEMSIKLVDFGTAVPYNKKTKMLTEVLGTPYYIAPEVIQTNYDNKCDIWSAGVITFLLLTGTLPF
jgi:calcium-dependent protein kinase